MSYDINLCDAVTGDRLLLSEPHQIRGGTYIMGGTSECWLNVTWNYGEHFYRIMGEKGIREIYGKTGAESAPLLENAIAQLGDDVSLDYWEPTEGNAKRALNGLLAFSKLRPDGVWSGDCDRERDPS